MNTQRRRSWRPFGAAQRAARRAAASFAAVSIVASAGCHATYDRDRVRERTAFVFGPAGPRPASADASAGAGRAPADAEIRETADLERYVRYGLARNAGLGSAYERWRSLLERIPQASSLPDPMFGYGSDFTNSIETRTGPQRNRFSVSQTLPFFGKLGLGGAVAEHEAEAAWFAVVDRRLDVERAVREAFHEYAWLAQAIRITDANLGLLQRLEPVAQRKYQGGGGQEDLLRLQVEIGTVENDLASLRDLRPALSQRLAAAMNFPGRATLPFPELREPTITERDSVALLELAGQHNPDLLRLAEEVRRWQRKVELAALEKWPDLTVGLDYIDTGEARVPNTPGSGDDPLMFNVMMNVPLWRSKYAAAEREAEHGETASRRELMQREFELRSALSLEAYELANATRQIVLYRDSLLPRARQALEVTGASYRGGTATLTDVIDSERVLLQFEKSYWRACADYLQSEARLDALCGGEL